MHHRSSAMGRKRYVRMAPLDVRISTDSVSFIIIPSSYVVDGIERHIARRRRGLSRGNGS